MDRGVAGESSLLRTDCELTRAGTVRVLAGVPRSPDTRRGPDKVVRCMNFNAFPHQIPSEPDSVNRVELPAFGHSDVSSCENCLNYGGRDVSVPFLAVSQPLGQRPWWRGWP